MGYPQPPVFKRPSAGTFPEGSYEECQASLDPGVNYFVDPCRDKPYYGGIRGALDRSDFEINPDGEKDEEDKGSFLDSIIKELVIEDLRGSNKADEDVGSIMGGPVSYALKAKGNAADMLTKAMGNFGLAKSLI